MQERELATPPPAAELADVLGDCLRDVGQIAGAHCLVEGQDARVVAHSLATHAVPDVVADAVLHRSVRKLASELHDRATAAVLPGGPVVLARLATGCPVLCAPLCQGGQRTGWLWLFPERQKLEVPHVKRLAIRVAAACPSARADAQDEALRKALSGLAPLPRALVEGVAQVWVATVDSADPTVSPADVERALAAHRTVIGPTLYTVLASDALTLIACTAAELSDVVVQAMVEQLLAGAGAELGVPLRAALAEPVDPRHDLARAGAQSAAALAARPQDGRCMRLAEARADIVLDQLCAGLASAAELGPDPTTLLADRRGNDLAPTLLAWLDAHGDVPRTARCLGIHANTLRYRLGVIGEQCGFDLDEPAVRLELHLRLRAASRTC